jgi:hypothetical protein
MASILELETVQLPGIQRYCLNFKMHAGAAIKKRLTNRILSIPEAASL